MFDLVSFSGAASLSVIIIATTITRGGSYALVVVVDLLIKIERVNKNKWRIFCHGENT